MHFQSLQIVSLFLFVTFARSILVDFNRMAINSVNCHCFGEKFCLTCDPAHEAGLILVDPSTDNNTLYSEFNLQPGCQSIPSIPHIRKDSFCVDFDKGTATFELDTDSKKYCLQRVAKYFKPCDRPECFQSFWIECANTACHLIF